MSIIAVDCDDGQNDFHAYVVVSWLNNIMIIEWFIHLLHDCGNDFVSKFIFPLQNWQITRKSVTFMINGQHLNVQELSLSFYLSFWRRGRRWHQRIKGIKLVIIYKHINYDMDIRIVAFFMTNFYASFYILQ